MYTIPYTYLFSDPSNVNFLLGFFSGILVVCKVHINIESCEILLDLLLDLFSLESSTKMCWPLVLSEVWMASNGISSSAILLSVDCVNDFLCFNVFVEFESEKKFINDKS